MSTLEVRDLEVEAGGKTVVQRPELQPASGGQDRRRRAATEPARPAPSRCSPARRPPRGGTAIRRGALGYLRQDPRQHREDDGITGPRVHPGRPRPRRDGPAASRRRGSGSRRSHADAQRGAVRARRGGVSGRRRLPGRIGGARRSRRGSGWRRTGSALHVGALSGGERRRLELARILFGGSDLLLLDEPTNHLDADAKGWLMKFLATYKGALMVVSHDIGLLDALDHADPAPGSRRRRRVQGHLLAVPRGRARRTRTGFAALAARQEQEIRRLKTLADSMRGQTAKRARKAKTLDTRAAKLRGAEGRRAGAGTYREVPVPRAAALRQDRADGRRTSPSPTAARRCSRT